jgi:hypothetical protein
MFGQRKEAREKLSNDPRFAGKSRDDLLAKKAEIENRKGQYSESNGHFYKKGKPGSISKEQYTSETKTLDEELQ